MKGVTQSQATRCRQATMRPELSRPAFMKWALIGRNRPLRTSSSRVHMSLTGRRTSLDSSTESTTNSSSRWPRRPNPPPSSVLSRRTFWGGMPRVLATAATAIVCPWLPTQMSQASPAGDTEATELSGSIWA